MSLQFLLKNPLNTDKFDVCSYRLFYAYITGANPQRVNIYLIPKLY